MRVSAAFGTFEELTWEAPEVNLVIAFDLGPRAVLSIAGGYAILDNHNYLSDGRSGRLEVGAGAVFGKVRVGGIVGLTLIGFHSDPDLLADQPDVDLVVSRGGLVPTAGFEVSRSLGATLRTGVFARVALRRLEVFDTATDRETARLILGGAYLGFVIR